MDLVDAKSNNAIPSDDNEGACKLIANNSIIEKSPLKDFELAVRNLRSKTKLVPYNDVTKIGTNYQADIPDFIPVEQRSPSDFDEREELIWAPIDNMPEKDMSMYLEAAMQVYNFSYDQALGFLNYHKDNVVEALRDLQNYESGQRKWSEEEKQMFELGFATYGKRFELVKKMLPERSVSDILQYYYRWKKTPSKASHLDQTSSTFKFVVDDGLMIMNTKPSNCQLRTSQTYLQPRPKKMKTTDSESGLFSNEQLFKMAKMERSAIGNERELGLLSTEIAKNKTIIDHMLIESDNDVNSTETAECFLEPKDSKTSERWNKDEIFMLKMALREHGNDFEVISQIIGSKNSNQVRKYCELNAQLYDLYDEGMKYLTLQSDHL